MNPAIEDEVSILDIIRRLWEKRFIIFLSVIAGSVFAGVAWIATPVTTGSTYTMTVYPDGAVLYSADAIRAQLTQALAAEGYTSTTARDGTISVRVANHTDGTQIIGTVLTLTASIHASLRRAAERGGTDCNEFCMKLDAWVDAHEAEMFELIAVSVTPYRIDRRPAHAALSFIVPILITVFLVLIIPIFRDGE